MNEYVTVAPVLTSAFAKTVLAAYKTVPLAELIPTPKLRLSKDPLFNPGPESVIADFTPNEADFTGYPAGGSAPVLSAPFKFSLLLWGLQQTVVFASSGSAAQNTIYGYWLDDGSDVIIAEKFAGGQTAAFNDTGDFLALDVRVPFYLTPPAA